MTDLKAMCKSIKNCSLKLKNLEKTEGEDSTYKTLNEAVSLLNSNLLNITTCEDEQVVAALIRFATATEKLVNAYSTIVIKSVNEVKTLRLKRLSDAMLSMWTKLGLGTKLFVATGVITAAGVGFGVGGAALGCGLLGVGIAAIAGIIGIICYEKQRDAKNKFEDFVRGFEALSRLPEVEMPLE